MHRFFLEEMDEIKENEIRINSPETLNHMVKSLRIKQNEQIEIVFDAKVYISSVETINQEFVLAKIVMIKNENTAQSFEIDLYQCLPKGSKLELIIQKNVELGVSNFFLVNSDRCVVDWGKKDIDKKLSRYEKIIKEATKQSKGTFIPSIQGVINLKNLKENIKQYDLFLVLYENEERRSIKEMLQEYKGESLKGKKIATLVGPEGGLTNEEVDFLKMSGAQVATLGSRILRTETAGFFATVCIQYELEM